jgi:hypothetical protein
MILKIIPFLLIIIPLIGFFFTPEPPGASSRVISDLVYFLFTIPWWGKLLSIVIGVFWVSKNSKK